MNNRVFIIAEAGVNHNGSVEIAKRMVEASSASGADAVKFQTFKAERIVSKSASSQLDMLKKLELDVDAHEELIEFCRSKNILFLSSPFDLESISLLSNLGIEIFKIPSGEITNLPYLKEIGRLRKKVIMSTGMADLEEAKIALDALMKEGSSKKDITVLHCNTEYPTPVEDANLMAMLTMKEALKVNVGYSDHTLGIEVPIAAVALGATVIEKHFTLDRSMEGPDQAASLEPTEFKAMVSAIRNIEKALGNGNKRPSPSELKNRIIARKSIVALKCIEKGESFTAANITAKRPAKGISPM